MYPTVKFLEYFKKDVPEAVLQEVENITEENFIFEYTEEDDNTTITYTNETIGEIGINRGLRNEC